ncbi:glycosyl transferase [Lentibacillus kapialis]|uniref:Glycosyl transferase n=1 Tax=Lentibacillus kapialis TaxID=340214 RepID=A0A917PWJ9_9BACI|nr:glycosyltransferase [Lentibacillus kapialis]GGJ95065.1 glycosyl transferase [Lentibacillus kapialis]
MRRLKVTHIIIGLNMGGAETMLYKLLKHTDHEKFDIQVISMMGQGVYGPKIEKLGVKVHCLNMNKSMSAITGFLRAKKLIKDTDVIQTWMYHADLFGYLLTSFSKQKKLIWGIRRNNLDLRLNKKSTMFIAKINSKLSAKVDKVVSCSIKAKRTHENFGYTPENIVVIPNGFEVDNFNRIDNAKYIVSNMLGKDKGVPYITHVGRWNNLKDYNNFIKALSIINQIDSNFHVLMAGTNIDESNEELMHLIEKFNLNDKISLLGRRDDIPTVMSAADLFVLSSIDEGFPNVVGEAMACKTPCVVTNAGDSAYVVGETGETVPIKDSQALAEGIEKILNMSNAERKKLGEQARNRVLEKFDIKQVTKQFEELYEVDGV